MGAIKIFSTKNLTSSNKSNAFILKCMIATTFFIPFHHFDFLNIFHVINPLVVLGVILHLKLLYQIAMKKKSIQLKITFIDKLYFIFVLSALISSFSAISVLGSLNWIFYSVTTGYIVYKVLSYLSFEELINVITFLIYISATSALYGIIEYSIGFSIIYGELFKGRLTSLLGHPLVNGIVFASTFPLSLVLYISTRQKRFALTSILIFFALIFTQSRGSWLALLAGMLIFFIIAPAKIKTKFIAPILIFFFCFVLFPKLYEPFIGRIFQDETEMHSSFNIRIESIPIALEIFKNKPLFGGGLRNSTRYKYIYATDGILRKTSFENSYLGLLVDLGIIGIGILFLICINILLICVRNIKIAKHNLYPLATFVSFIILLLNIGTFNFDTHRIFNFVLWLFIGFNVSLFNNKEIIKD